MRLSLMSDKAERMNRATTSADPTRGLAEGLSNARSWGEEKGRIVGLTTSEAAEEGG